MNSFRIPCIGGCGRMVIKAKQSECRKCRRKRIHAGLRRLRTIEREKRAEQWREAMRK